MVKLLNWIWMIGCDPRASLFMAGYMLAAAIGLAFEGRFWFALACFSIFVLDLVLSLPDVTVKIPPASTPVAPAPTDSEGGDHD